MGPSADLSSAGKSLEGPGPCRLLISGRHLPQELENLNKWGLNIFHVSDYAGGRSLSCIMYTIFQVGWAVLGRVGGQGWELRASGGHHPSIPALRNETC